MCKKQCCGGCKKDFDKTAKPTEIKKDAPAKPEAPKGGCCVPKKK